MPNVPAPQSEGSDSDGQKPKDRKKLAAATRALTALLAAGGVTGMANAAHADQAAVDNCITQINRLSLSAKEKDYDRKRCVVALLGAKGSGTEGGKPGSGDNKGGGKITGGGKQPGKDQKRQHKEPAQPPGAPANVSQGNQERALSADEAAQFAQIAGVKPEQIKSYSDFLKIMKERAQVDDSQIPPIFRSTVDDWAQRVGDNPKTITTMGAAKKLLTKVLEKTAEYNKHRHFNERDLGNLWVLLLMVLSGAGVGAGVAYVTNQRSKKPNQVRSRVAGLNHDETVQLVEELIKTRVRRSEIRRIVLSLPPPSDDDDGESED